ncbi:MAG: hypothetical protein BWY88_00509 [Synergistetes bacterium ADurb.Bin520]|nr:MAG: hypothetical protein BWY88_00509 [Synergistetes bacterium ADurb.Bin520]
MAPKALVHQTAEFFPVLPEKGGAFLEGDALGAVPPVVGGVAGGLVREQVDGFSVGHGILQEVHDVALVGDGGGFPALQVLSGDAKDLPEIRRSEAHPPLVGAGADPGGIHLRHHPHGAGDLRRLGLGPAHAPQPRGDEEPSPEVTVVSQGELQPSRVEDGVEGAVDDALGADVHPSPCGHLAVVGHPDLHGPVPVGGVVVHPHEEAVGDDDPGGVLTRPEEPQGVAGLHHQGLLVGEDFQIAHDQAVLHPVLAHLPRFAVGHQLVGVEGHGEIEVVVDHHLKGPAFEALSPIGVDGLAPEGSRRTEAVAVDPSPG